MGDFINTGNAGFRESRNGKYVDKSGLISFVNAQLFTKNKFFCVTRARRFGKTLAAEMLCAYYDKSCDSHELFDDLEISTNPTLNKTYLDHLNKYPTIYVDMTDFVSDKPVPGSNVVDSTKFALLEDLKKEYPNIDLGGKEYKDALIEVYNKTGEEFIFIMDEWDAVLREFADDKEIVKDWIDFLRGLFKNTRLSKVFAGVYITGILPFIKDDSQSALNNFWEYNMIEPMGLENYFGFTEDEVQTLCGENGMDFPLVKSWYDGYTVGDATSIFNPSSVMKAISSKKVGLYWRTTGAGDELSQHLRYEMKSDVEALMRGESIPVDITSFENSIKDIGSRDKVLTMFIHLGYLSYNNGEAHIPNMELLLYFASCIKNADLGGLTRVISRSEEMLECIRKGKSERFSELMSLCHDDVCGSVEYNNGQALYTTLRESLIFAQRDYILHREYPTGKGFADLVLIPRPNRNIPGIVIELKWDKNVQGPISQIKERDYTQKVFEYTDNVILVGINYDKNSKVHECTMESVSKE